MFSSAMYRIETATSVSISGGNHRASGAKPRADAISVIEWATVNAVTTPTSGPKRRNGTTRANRKRRWSMPSKMWRKPSLAKDRKACSQLGSRCTVPTSAWTSNARSGPSGGRKRMTTFTRSPRRVRPGRMAKSERSDPIAYSYATSRRPCFQ